MTNSPKSVQHTAAMILANPAPVLAVDACGILDLMRSQYRIEAPSRLLEMALGAQRISTQNPIELHLVMFSQVKDEILKNIGEERKKLKEHASTLKNTGGVVLSATDVETWKRAVQTIQEVLSSFPQKWIEMSTLISPDPACMLRAQARLTGGIAPGKRGSNNVGDCVIVEHLLELGDLLRKGAFTAPFFFVSSNVKDFGRTVLKPPLDFQFQATSIDYLPHIEAAMVQLGY